MRAPYNACCLGGREREEEPVSGRAFLIITSIYGAIGFFAYAVAVFYP